MPNIFKHFSQAKADLYVFPDADELKVDLPPEPEPEPEPQQGEDIAEEQGEEEKPLIAPQEPVSYARLQAEMILQSAREEAEELLEQARQRAREEAEEIRRSAQEEGRLEGHAQGVEQALAEGRQKQEQQAAALEAQVQQFLEKASAKLDSRMDEAVDDLRELAMAVAEKVVCVSLKSSADVIGRMIQTAVDKRKRREWVHIYIAECDAKRMGSVSASLASALAALSDRVRIIPMADDESGTCIIEMPDEIIDASAATQLNNIKNLVMERAPDLQGSDNLHIFSV